VRGYEGVPAAVLGASGFIGSWVARKLTERGACVYRIGREDVANLESAFRRFRPSITFNLAGYGVDPSERDEATAYRVNAELPRVLAQAVAAWKDPAWPGQHLVHAGSAAEYGDAGGDLREDGPARPATLYARSKERGTQAVAERCRALGLRGVTARLFTVYGPGERAGRLLPALLETSRSRQPLNLSAGLQQRDFTYVEDVAEGLLKVGLAAKEGGPIVNLATGRLTPVRTFVEIAAGILGIPPEKLNFGAIPSGAHEMEQEGVALDRLQELVGWIPPTSIAEGVRKTVEMKLLIRAEL
jgi:nucleoside-diphosphate-sugar epimerase